MEEKDIIRRNIRLKAFFKALSLDVEIYGNINTPAIIYNDSLVLSCYVKNFDLIFTDAPKGGVEQFRYKLLHNQEFNEQQIDLINNWLHNYTHRPCFRVMVTGTNLYLAGFNFINKERTPENQYPVFSEFGFRYYFDINYAQGIIDDYSSDTLNLELV